MRTDRLEFNGADVMTAQPLKAKESSRARHMRSRRGGARSALARVVGLLHAARAKARSRSALDRLSHHTLHDIGLTWIHGYRECRRPFRHD
jgi:uncharacterized protein YjiS (DUF1127 family)